MSDRYFVQIDPVTRIPFVYLNNPLLLKKPNIFEVNENKVKKFLKMQKERRPYGDAPQLSPDERALALIREEERKLASSDTGSNPVTSDIQPQTKIEVTVAGEKSQSAKYQESVAELETFRRATQIEEFMLRRYRVEIPHGSRDEVLTGAMVRLQEMRDTNQL